MTFQPKFAQVVELVEFSRSNPEAMFDVVPGGFVDASAPPF